MQTTRPSLNAVAEQVILDRRRLHTHPELGFQEVETALPTAIDLLVAVAERYLALG